ncbi:MAG: T9SS type A sorting domain-containing protein [Bacteroidetes bacterium]|nr:T9SS type A sorting domain-containing protein [Bacteroidota bacterium]
MKKLLTLLSILMLCCSSAFAQCTSSITFYDLTVSGNTVLGPSGTQFLSALICSGGRLMDSTSCCTRYVHIETGGTYEAGPNAYGYIYIKTGGTFDAHGNNSFFGVSYEAGATILNYTGPMSLCAAVVFPAGSCASTSISDVGDQTNINAYPNPCNDVLYLNKVPAGNPIISVYDIAGRKVMETLITGNTIDVSPILSGIYSYRISLDGQTVSIGKLAVAH